MDSKKTLHLFNTASRALEEIHPMDGKKIRMYTCGPTVYNFAHIGNFRTYVFEDLLRRTIQFFGMSIEQVMNLTDVDDKTIRGAIEKNVTLDAFCAPYIRAFFEDLQTLNIQKAEHYPAATQYIPEMIRIIQGLLEKGVAYQASDKSIYFSIKHFPRYGCLSHLHLDELQAGASDRIAHDEYTKESISDFVLWKAYDPERDGKIFWESPFGLGRPGWHIECSAMAMKILGSSIDIHVGGVDNMFPHHENEIAQSEAFSGKQFVQHWLHSEHLLVDHRKMSKSLGNFYTLRDLLEKGYSGREVRYLLLQTHYRTQLNFTLQGLDAARSALQRWEEFIKRVKACVGGKKNAETITILKHAEEDFTEGLAHDLNISAALAALFDAMRSLNALIDVEKVGKEDSEAIMQFLTRIDSVLGVLPLDVRDIEVPYELQALLEERQRARAEKRWKDADSCRDKIYAAGYIIEDTPQGARLKKT